MVCSFSFTYHTYLRDKHSVLNSLLRCTDEEELISDVGESMQRCSAIGSDIGIDRCQHAKSPLKSFCNTEAWRCASPDGTDCTVWCLQIFRETSDVIVCGLLTVPLSSCSGAELYQKRTLATCYERWNNCPEPLDWARPFTCRPRKRAEKAVRKDIEMYSIVQKLQAFHKSADKSLALLQNVASETWYVKHEHQKRTKCLST